MTEPTNGVRVEKSGIVGRVIMDRPAKRNALDRASTEAMLEGLGALERDPAVRIILVTGEGPDFCVGMDPRAALAMSEATPEEAREDVEVAGRLLLTIRALMKPVVCAVHGRALGLGAAIAIAADMVLAHQDAEFGFPEVRFGSVPAMAMTLLRRAVGEKQGADLVLTGRIVDAEEAGRIGLCSRVLTAATFEDETAAVLAGLARSSVTALALTKWLYYKLDTMTFDDGVAAAVVTGVEARSTDDFKSGMKRALEESLKAGQG
ncbi:MAG: Enoyl-CoA hydratase/carnithine racemase [Gemmatimonadetes bacterium]|nr:Enoyl-CoA hydratase/carnithine racemase [Gemmatimonadota bacterium]